MRIAVLCYCAGLIQEMRHTHCSSNNLVRTVTFSRLSKSEGEKICDQPVAETGSESYVHNVDPLVIELWPHLGVGDHGEGEARDDNGAAGAVREVEPFAHLAAAHREKDGPAR